MDSDADISHSAILVSARSVEWRARMNYPKIQYTDFVKVLTVMRNYWISNVCREFKKQYITWQLGLLNH